MVSSSPPLPLWFRLLPWALLPVVLLPLLLFLAPSPQSGFARAAIEAGEAMRPISIARLFEGGSPAPSILSLAVLDWQSLIGIGLTASGMLAVVASLVRTRDPKLVVEFLVGILSRWIMPAVMGLLLIGPVWAGYEMPTSRMAMTTAHIILVTGGWMISGVPIVSAVALWTFPLDQLRSRTADRPAAQGPIARRSPVRMALLGSNGLEIGLRLIPVLLVFAAWVVLRFQNMLADELLLAFIDGGTIVRQFALPEMLGWTARVFAGLDPLQSSMIQAFHDWQGFALSLALGSGLVLLILEWRRTLPQRRLSWLLKLAFGLGLFGVFFYWFIGGILRSSIDPAGWHPEMVTVMVLFAVFGLTVRDRPKQDEPKEKAT